MGMDAVWRLLEEPTTCSMSYSVTLWLLVIFNSATWKNLKMYRHLLQAGGFHMGRSDLTDCICKGGRRALRCWAKRKRLQHFPGTFCQRLVIDFLEMSNGNKMCGISILKCLYCATSHLRKIASRTCLIVVKDQLLHSNVAQEICLWRCHEEDILYIFAMYLERQWSNSSVQSTFWGCSQSQSRAQTISAAGWKETPNYTVSWRSTEVLWVIINHTELRHWLTDAHRTNKGVGNDNTGTLNLPVQ